MGKAFLSKSTGGGGGGLNFRVVGGTSAPASPKANDIWVNTSAEITSYIFSATEPANYAEGMVWILTGTASDAEFNALQKNNITVYPLSASQSIGGAWVEKSAKSYQSGAWVDLFQWNGELYDAGNEYIAYTGGWQARALNYVNNNDAYSALAPDVTKNADHIHVGYTKPGTCPGGGLEIAKDIDLTGWNSITADVGYDVDSCWVYLAVIDRDITVYSGNEVAGVLIASGTKTGREIISLDISDLSGKYDIIFYFRAGSGSRSYSIDLYSAMLEV